MRRVTFHARGNGYHDVHIDGKKHPTFSVKQADRSNGNNRYGGGVYHLSGKEGKILMTGNSCRID